MISSDERVHWARFHDVDLESLTCRFSLDEPGEAAALQVGLAPVVTDISGAWALTLLMPSDPKLQGVQAALQAALFGTAGPLGLNLSTG